MKRVGQLAENPLKHYHCINSGALEQKPIFFILCVHKEEKLMETNEIDLKWKENKIIVFVKPKGDVMSAMSYQTNEKRLAFCGWYPWRQELTGTWLGSKLIPTWKSFYYDSYRYDFQRVTCEIRKTCHQLWVPNSSEGCIHLTGKPACSTKLLSSHLTT